jgi:hypothetical protein
MAKNPNASLKVERYETTVRSKEELITAITGYQSNVTNLRKRNQIGKIKIHLQRRHFLELYRLNKDNSKQVMPEYDLGKQTDPVVYIRNHKINRYMNESDEGQNTQGRLAIEGILGVCVIDYIPSGWSDARECVISSIDKGNWCRGHLMLFANDVQPWEVHQYLPVLRFQKSRLIKIIDSSAAKSTEQMQTLRSEFSSKLDDKHPYSIREAFKAIGYEELVDDYLDSNIDLGIIIADENVILKEMIDTNNIFNLWESIVYAFCSISKDRTDVDLGNVLSAILDDKKSSYYSFLHGKFFKKLKDKLDSCREYYLLPILLLEGYRLGSSDITKTFKKKISFMEMCERYSDVNKLNWIESPIVKFVHTNIIQNSQQSLDFDKSKKFISLFDMDEIKNELNTIVTTITELESAIKSHVDNKSRINIEGFGVNNLGQFKLGTKASEQVLLYIMCLIYEKMYKKQSLNKDHIVFILKRLSTLISSVYEVEDNVVTLTPSSISKEAKLLLTKFGYDGRVAFIDAAFQHVYEEYQQSYGSKSKNAVFKKLEKENIEKLFERALGKIGKRIPISFVVPTGNLNENQFELIEDIREDFFKLEWSHIETGVDTYENGYLWGSIQAGVGAASKYMYKTKLDAYRMMIEVMTDSKLMEETEIELWKKVLDYWEANYKADLSDMK